MKRLALAALCAAACAGCPDEELETVVIELRLEPGVVDFEVVPTFTESRRTVFAINDGNAPLSLAEPPRIDGGEGAFGVELVELALGAAEFVEFGVTFTPERSGAHDASLVLTPEAPGEPVALTLRGEGEPAAVAFDPEALDFGQVWAGQSAADAVSLQNLSTASVVVVLAFDGPGFLSEGRDRFGVSLGPSASVSIPLEFLPSRGGPYETALVAETCGQGCGPRVMLTGRGQAPRIDVTPRPLELGEVSADEPTLRTVTVRNVGSGALALLQVDAVDTTGALSIEALDGDGVTLEEDDAVELEVTFAPSGPDGAFQGTLVFDSSDPLSPRVLVPVEATVPGRGLRVLPQALHFGVLDAGDQSEADIVLLSTGTEAVTVTGLWLSGDGFDWAVTPGNLPFVLEPQQSIVYTVVAEATAELVAVGGGTGTVEVDADADADDVPLTFLSGTEGCQPRADPDNANIGFVRIGDGGQQSLVIENVGTADCVLASAGPRVGLPFDAGFSYIVDADVLVPGQAGLVTFGFLASAPGSSSAFVELLYEDTAAPVLVSSTAVAVSGSLVPEPPTLDFGPAPVDCPSKRRVMNFINDGAGPVNITAITLAPPAQSSEFDLLLGVGLPKELAPGAGFEVIVQSKAHAQGLFSASVVASTIELGDISGSVSSEVSPAGQPVVETFTVGEAASKVDVLFVVDNSGSMFDDQQRLANNFDAFIEAAEQTDIDFHLGVTSTDVLTEAALKGALRGPPTVLDNTTGSLTTVFANHVTLGTGGAGIELGLEAMRLALSEPLASTSNIGFHRVDAALSVIVVSDEDDSGQLAEDWGFPEYNKTIEAYETFLRGLKGGVLTDTNVIFNAVIHPSFSPRYTDLVDRFGGVKLDISSDTWGEQLSTIGAATFALPRAFTLEHPADELSIQVTVDGVPTTLFTYDPQLGAVLLDEAPDEGAVIEIEYVPLCA